MNLESLGFPVRLYSEMNIVQTPSPTLEASSVAEGTSQGQIVQASMTSGVPAQAPAPEKGPEVHRVEKQSRAHEDPIGHLAGQVPQPCEDRSPPSNLAPAACALMTREFSVAMG